MIYPLLRRALFHLDAEAAHEWTAEQIQHLQQIPIALRAIERFCRPLAGARRTLIGLDFPSPIGIAGGFDKIYPSENIPLAHRAASSSSAADAAPPTR